MTKFSGEPKYEPEARAELAIAYLLHYWRDRLAGDVNPVSDSEFFEAYSGVTDHGSAVGLTAHQSPNALAAAVSKVRSARGRRTHGDRSIGSGPGMRP